jgi:hypothetical protein
MGAFPSPETRPRHKNATGVQELRGRSRAYGNDQRKGRTDPTNREHATAHGFVLSLRDGRRCYLHDVTPAEGDETFEEVEILPMRHERCPYLRGGGILWCDDPLNRLLRTDPSIGIEAGRAACRIPDWFGMSYRKGEDTPARKRRRLPYKVVIEREAPFRDVDSKEVAECRRVTHGEECHHAMERVGRVYWHVMRFASEQQAEAFRQVAHRAEYARRPAPQFGPSPEDRKAFSEAALLWSLRTGALRLVLKAYQASGRAPRQPLSSSNVLAKTLLKGETTHGGQEARRDCFAEG